MVVIKIDKDIAEFVQKLDFTGGKYSAIDIFRDLITLETYLIYATLLEQKDKAKEFDEFMTKYTANEQVQMWQLVFDLTNLYKKQNKPNDILGEIFNRLNMGNVKSGQFFTPNHISECVAKITSIDENEIKERGYLPLHEPSCRCWWYDISNCRRIRSKRLCNL